MPIVLNGTTGDISGSSLTGIDTGKILAVSEALKKDSFSTQSASFTDITGLSVTMTPASASSKFLVSYNVCFSPRDYSYSAALRCVKVVGGTTTDDIYVGNTAGSRTRCSNFSYSENLANSHIALQTQSGTFLHSPNTTSAVTFKMQCSLLGTYNWANDVWVNRTNTWNDNNTFGSPVSSIVVRELVS
tara:strand:+ start:49 stop:612 length:564 start_codon:yes stop_codon:yes gene_type:complete